LSSIFSSHRAKPHCFQQLNSQSLKTCHPLNPIGQSSHVFRSFQTFQPPVFGHDSDVKEPVKRYKGNTPHMFDLVVTGLFGALSGVGYLISAANPFIGVPLLAVGGFGAVRQVMTNFVYRAVKAGMA
jgi:hypothetical protein